MLSRTLTIALLSMAALASGCNAGDLKVLQNPRVTGSLRGFVITYDGSDDPQRCVGTNPSITADEDGQALSYEGGKVADQCDQESGFACSASHQACLPPSFSLNGTIDDAVSTTLHIQDGEDNWAITVERGGTVTLEGAPTDGGPVTDGDTLTVHCAPTSGRVIRAYLAYPDNGVENEVAITDGGIVGGDVTFTISSEQQPDDTTITAQVTCEVAYVATLCQGPASCELTGPLRGGTVPVYFPQL